jgi:hypothetical protein
MRNSKVLGKGRPYRSRRTHLLGFFGEVKLAYWLRQPVACKILFKREFRRTTEMERFIREVDVLRYENAVTLFDILANCDIRR